jgi:sRNA-binding protein
MKTFTSTHHNAIWAVSGKALGSPLRQGLFQDLQPWLLGSCWGGHATAIGIGI